MNLGPELTKSLEPYQIQLDNKVTYAQIEIKIKKMIQIGFKGLVKNGKNNEHCKNQTVNYFLLQKQCWMMNWKKTKAVIQKKLLCVEELKQHSTLWKTVKFFKGLLLLSTKISKTEGLVKLIFNIFWLLIFLPRNEV